MSAFDQIFNNPMTMMGLGLLSGNYGRDKRQAFANAMGGGLQGLQQAQIATLRSKAEERAQAEEERKQKEYERMVHQANAQRQLGMSKLYKDFEQDLFPGEQPIQGLYGGPQENLSTNEQTAFELIAAGYNPAVAGQFANYMGAENRAALAEAHDIKMQRMKDAAALERAKIQAGAREKDKAYTPVDFTKSELDQIKEWLEQDFDTGFWDRGDIDIEGVESQGLEQEVMAMMGTLINRARSTPGMAPVSMAEAYQYSKRKILEKYKAK